MKNVMVILVLALAMGGCNSPSIGCAIQGGADALLAPAIATGLQCANQAAVVTSLQQAGSKAGLCVTSTPTLGAPAIMCQTLGNALVTFLGSAAIPSEWQCSPTAAMSSLNGIINSACSKLGVKPPVKK